MDFLQYPYVWTALAFVLGAIVGSFLNVCIARMPLEKSVLWPGSRCGNCFQPIRWYDNIPLVSYWLLRGHCRQCGATFSARYFWIEFFTGLTFAGLFWLEVVVNIRGVALTPLTERATATSVQLLWVWLYHAAFFSFLIVATFTDIDYTEIPRGITIWGTMIGVIGGTLAPWPWPLPPAAVVDHYQLALHQPFPGWDALTYGGAGLSAVFPLPAGLQHWPVWQPLPEWLPPSSWQLGLVTALAGAGAGFLLFLLIRWVFTWAFGKEAMGLGDADLMMMVGSFLGWQAIFFVLIFAIFLGLLYAIVLIVRNKGNELPFGPFLAGGAVLTTLLSWWLAHAQTSQPYFFDLTLIVMLSSATAVLALFMTLTIRMFRLIGQAAP